MHKDVIVIGAGGHAKVIVDIVRKSGDNLVGFLDDSKESGTECFDAFILGTPDSYAEYADKEFIIAVGRGFLLYCDSSHRRDWRRCEHRKRHLRDGKCRDQCGCKNREPLYRKHCLCGGA